MRHSVIALIAALTVTTPAQAHPPKGGEPWTNPVLDRDFADPAVLKAPNGWYYAYATQATNGKKPINVQVAKSKDLRAWTYLGDAMPTAPTWASKTQDVWAPHAHYANGKYYLYYSADPNEKKGLALGVAVADRPEGPFRATAKPLVKGPGFENIDPFAYDDPVSGKKLLYWGSGFKAIKVQELAADRLTFKPGSKPVEVLQPDSKRNYENLIEGAWVVRRNGWYYLFYSGDDCCGGFEGGRPPHYAVLVARSRSAFGPFVKYHDATKAKDSTILRAGAWEAPGHNSVVTGPDGRDWIVYHAMDPANRWMPGTKSALRPLLIDPLGWKDGWPTVRDGVPSGAP